MPVQETSKEAYESILKELPGRQAEVYGALMDIKVGSNFDIAQYLDLPINQVTPRVNELRKKKVVEEYDRDIQPETGRRVILWTLSKPDVSTTAA